MNIEKNIILDHFHNILSKNVLGNKQYESRFKGFIGELHFQQWILENKDPSLFYSGGYFLPRNKSDRSIKNPIYFTVSSDSPKKYLNIYESLSKLPCELMFFIKWKKELPFSQWQDSENIIEGLKLKQPDLIVYKFNKQASVFESVSLESFLNLFPIKPSRTNSRFIAENISSKWKQKLSTFENDLLLDLYVQRLIFDGYIGYSRIHGIPSDIDSIAYNNTKGSYSILEIKEKDLSKRHPQGFGMDVPRIEDLSLLTNKTNLPVFYIVRQVNNQIDRNFISWKCINLSNFKKNLPEHTIQGGSGMGFENGSYETKICPYDYFKDLK